MLKRILPILLGFLAACDAYYDEFYDVTAPGTVVYDQTLPYAIEDVFATCHQPLAFTPAAPFDPAGSCDSFSDLPDLPSQIVWGGLATYDPIDVAGAFPSDLTSLMSTTVWVYDPLSWPLQNCDIEIETDLDLAGLELTGVDSSWTTHGGLPALTIDFDPTGAPLATGDIDGTAHCPSLFGFLNQAIINPHLPRGYHTISLGGVDLDVWFSLAFSGRDVTATVDVAVNASSISLSPPLDSAIGDFQSLLADQGITLAKLTRDLERSLEAELAGTADQIALLVEAGVPAGQRICSLGVASGKLTMKTAAKCL